MSLASVTVKNAAGKAEGLQPYFHTLEFAGDAAYPDGGSANFLALLQAAVGAQITPIAVHALNCGAYFPEITQSPASLLIAPASWPVADQTGKTILYKLNGGAEQTITHGTATTAAHIAEDITAETGLVAYVEGDDVRVKTNAVGASASLEITGGTALTALGMTAGTSYGSATQLLRINAIATGADAGAAAESTDLSGTTFKVLVVSE